MKLAVHIKHDTDHYTLMAGYNLNTFGFKLQILQGRLHDYTKGVVKDFIKLDMGFLFFFIELRVFI